ncbi:hypothetical protein ACFL4G_10345 [Thermodesulfobacteriota bacterium]
MTETRKTMLLACVLTFLLASAGTVLADWDEGESFKWLQWSEEPEACCFDDGWACWDETPTECWFMGATSQGPGTFCTVDETCCINGGASCMDVDPLCCDDLGGTPSPLGEAACLGDGNGDGFDDACVKPGCFLRALLR